MLRSLRACLPGVIVLCAASRLFAQATDDRYALPPIAEPAAAHNPAHEQATPAPPAWNDAASVYLNTQEQPRPCEPAGRCDPSEGTCSGDTCSCPISEPRVSTDPRVAQAAYQVEARSAPREEAPQRRLAPPSDAVRADTEKSSTAAAFSKSWGLPLDSLATTIAALVLVVGLFLLCMWALRRGSRIATGQLPRDAVSVLGSTPLAGRQMAQLLRVGNKLVLISVTPSGAEPLAEVSDPAEVDRLLDLCLQGGQRAAKQVYEKTFPQFQTEPSLKGLPTLDLPLAKAPSPPDLYRAYQGATERA